MSREKLLPWAKPLLLSSTLTQATIYVLRPMSSSFMEPWP